MTGQSSRAPRNRSHPHPEVLNPIAIITPTTTRSPRNLARQSLKAPNSGFFGSTSFSAALNQATNGLLGTQDDIDEDPQVVSARLLLGVKVLKLLPSRIVGTMLVENYATNFGEVGFPKAIVKETFNSFWSTYGSHLNESRSNRQLERLSQELNTNTRCSINQDGNSSQWKASFTGLNTRWESVGIIFCAFAFGVAALSERDPLFNPESGVKSTRKEYLSTMKKCVELCIQLCQQMQSLNTLLCNLLYKNLLLETVIHGDSSISVWRLHHDLTAVATAMGLHCYQGTPEITMQSEMTKRLSASCFCSDKEISMFTGRPPAMSRRYYSCPLPYDVSDEALMAGGGTLVHELDRLDVHGWNQDGLMHNSTICRMMVHGAVIQDEIMELFIGSQNEFSMERINALRVKIVEVYSHVPSILEVTKESLMAQESDCLMWRLLFGRLDYIRIHFLLERLATERGGESKKNLLEVAKEIVDLVVFLWLQRDRSINRHYDYDYIIMCYGMPSTGILCTQLLKQTQYPEQFDPSVKLSRSEVVQNLSLMVGFLEWIRPSAGNYRLCQRMAKAIKKVLDQVFEPTIEIESVTGGEADSDIMQADESWIDELNDWDWLNSIDWSRGQHMDFLQ